MYIFQNYDDLLLLQVHKAVILHFHLYLNADLTLWSGPKSV